jgi:Kef-type K+ transport system membrane component KefB
MNLEQIIENVFHEFALILLIVALAGFLATLLRQPLLVAFIAVGILVGPSAIDLLRSKTEVHLLAELGISILLFVVGLKLDLSLIRTMGKVALLTGLGQVIFTSVFGYLIGWMMGFSAIEALYIAVALTFSSTIIIVKLLSDKKEIDSLHGQIAVGFLIVQDVVVILMMIALSAFRLEGEISLLREGLGLIFKVLGMIAGVAIFARYVIPPLVRQMARSQELLILFAISWAAGLAGLSDFIGFSKEVGAFLAGVSLASTPYREMISGRLGSLRDFLLLFFFIDLGAQVDLSLLSGQIVPALIFSVFVLVGNPLIVLVIMGLMGYKKRTSFLAGLTVAQISEFSLILAAQGFSLNLIDEEIVGLITLVGLITIGLSTYMIIYSHWLYDRLAPLLRIFQKKTPLREQSLEAVGPTAIDGIVMGLGRYGERISQVLLRHDLKILGVDFDPTVVRKWQKEGKSAYYGDAEDPELPAQLPIHQTQFIISTIPNAVVNRHLVRYLHDAGYQGRIMVAVHSDLDGILLEGIGEVELIYPFMDAAEKISERLG